MGGDRFCKISSRCIFSLDKITEFTYLSDGKAGRSLDTESLNTSEGSGGDGEHRELHYLVVVECENDKGRILWQLRFRKPFRRGVLILDARTCWNAITCVYSNAFLYIYSDSHNDIQVYVVIRFAGGSAGSCHANLPKIESMQ